MVVVTLLLGRSLFVPPTWGSTGSYRGANVEEHRSRTSPARRRPVVRAVPLQSEYEITSGGGPPLPSDARCVMAPVHGRVDLDGGEVVDRDAGEAAAVSCRECHRSLSARPSDPFLPRSTPGSAFTDNGGELSADACFDCHDPHSPISGAMEKHDEQNPQTPIVHEIAERAKFRGAAATLCRRGRSGCAFAATASVIALILPGWPPPTPRRTTTGPNIAGSI